MKRVILLIIIGVIVSIFGIVFSLQSQEIIGPETSFMYSNPDWSTYGLQITVLGIVIIGSGIVIKMLSRVNL